MRETSARTLFAATGDPSRIFAFRMVSRSSALISLAGRDFHFGSRSASICRLSSPPLFLFGFAYSSMYLSASSEKGTDPRFHLSAVPILGFWVRYARFGEGPSRTNGRGGHLLEGMALSSLKCELFPTKATVWTDFRVQRAICLTI